MASRQYFNHYLINPAENELINSIFSHNYEKLKSLLASNLCPDTKALTGQYSRQSAIFCAIGVSDMTLTKILLDFGADINQVVQGHTPLTYALTHDVPGSIIETLLKYSPDASIEVWAHYNANILAAQTENDNTFNKYFDSVAIDVNLQNSLGESALIALVKSDRTRYRRVEKILELGASVILKDVDGLDALDWALKLNKENFGFFKILQNLHTVQHQRSELLSAIPEIIPELKSGDTQKI